MEIKRKKVEDFNTNHKHSKHPIDINPWKFNSKNDLFSDYKADKFHWFHHNPEPNSLMNQQPFKIPKRDPQLFNSKLN